MPNPPVIKGQCLCGAIEFEVTPPSLWAAHCHCTQCRRSHGAAFVTWFGIAECRLHIHDDQNLLHWHQSSAAARRGFCRDCGSRLFFQSSRWPGEMHITLASLLTPLDREPTAHVFWDSHVAWAPTVDQHPHYGGESGTELLDDAGK